MKYSEQAHDYSCFVFSNFSNGWMLTICLSIFKSIGNGDTHQSEGLVSELVNYLNSISEAAETELVNGDTESDAVEVLNEIYQFISSPLLDQVLYFIYLFVFHVHLDISHL